MSTSFLFLMCHTIRFRTERRGREEQAVEHQRKDRVIHSRKADCGESEYGDRVNRDYLWDVPSKPSLQD